MTTTPEREKVVQWVEEAMSQGASKTRACQEIDISIRTLQRWKPVGSEQIRVDQRPSALRTAPANKLSPKECQNILSVCNQESYAHLPPSQIVPKLADKGEYLASESTFYRVLRKAGQLAHRGRSQAPRHKPKALVAQEPNQVWTWDISYLPTQVKGKYLYLYMVQDLYSRYVVGWEVHEVESGALGAELIEKTLLKERSFFKRPVLHSDNGAPMRSQTMLAKLQDLGVIPSRSRPGVSNDNPFIESLFKTVKYCPQWPTKGFESLESARAWMAEFVHWYNYEHQHSRLRFVTPAQKHQGQDIEILKQRQEVYAAARERNPERWAGTLRNWEPVSQTILNPDKEVFPLTA